ncbi:MAG: CPBP family intramembrane glutamic endopeptidase [Candidatus Neomarinimicrobiota bacterium]
MSTISELKHSSIAFFVLAYLITWAFWIPFVIFGPSAAAIVSNPDLRGSPLLLLQVLGNFGPTLAAVLLWVFAGKRSELRGALKRLLPHRAGLIWYIVVLLVPLGALLPGLFVYALLGGNIASFSIMNLALMFIPAIFISGFGEELGWRGYALTRLQQTKSPFSSSLIIGVFWGLWHLPIIYWVSSQTGMYFLVEFVLYVLLLTAASVIFTWVYNAMNQSLWMMIVMHASFTASGSTIAAFTQPVLGGTWVPYIVNVISVVIVAILITAFAKTWLFSRQDAV